MIIANINILSLSERITSLVSVCQGIMSPELFVLALENKLATLISLVVLFFLNNLENQTFQVSLRSALKHIQVIVEYSESIERQTKL